MKNRNVLMILVMFLVISVFVGGTFAYWTWSSKENQRTNVVVLADGDLFSCSADGGGLIDSSTVTVMPASCTNVNNAIIREVTVNVDLITSSSSTYLDLWLNIDDIAPELSNSQNLRYSLTTSNSSCDVGGGLSGSFNGTVIGDKVHVLRKIYTSDEPTTYTETYYLYIWLDAAETNIETAGKGFQFSLGGECADYVEDTSPSIEVLSDNNVASTQTVVLNLTDDYGIASYYYGTTDPSSNDVTWNDIQFSTNKTESVTIDSSGLWYFAVKDSSDNVVVVNKEFYEITLSVSNGTVTPTTVLTMSGDTFTLPIPVFGENYNFGGWYASSDYSGSSMTTYTPTSNSTLYANGIEDATYTISYDANGGTNAPDVQIKVNDTDLVISNSVPTRDGYTFLGWADTTDATTAVYQPGGTYTNNANITLYAVWQINTYTIVAHSDTGTIPTTTGWTAIGSLGTYMKTISYNSIYGTLPVPAKTGYVFDGWYDTTQSKTISIEDPSGLKYVHTSIIDNVYPGVTYTITMDSAVLNSGTATQFHSFVYDATDSMTVSNEVLMPFSNSTVTYTLTVPETVDSTHDLHIFIYAGVWGNTSGNSVTYNNVRVSTMGTSTATEYESVDNVSYVGNHMLFAHWTANTYTVSYNICGGSETPVSQTKTYGVTLTLSDIVPTKSGFTFKGWSTGGCGAASSTYAAGADYTINDSMTLYAVWESIDDTSPSCNIDATVNNNIVLLSATYSGGNITYYGWDPSYSGDNSTTKTVDSAGVVNYYVKTQNGNTNSCSIDISNATSLYTCSTSSKKYTSVACSSSNYSSPQSACTSSGYGYSSNSCTMGYYYQAQYNTCRLSSSGTYSFVSSEEGGKKLCSVGSSFACNANTVGRNYVYACRQLTTSPYYEGSISCYYHYCSSGTRDGNYCYLYDQTSCPSGWTSANSGYSCSAGYTHIDGSNYCYNNN